MKGCKLRLFAQLAQMSRGEVWQASSKSDRLGQELWAWFKGDLRREEVFGCKPSGGVAVCGLVRSSSPRLLGSCWSYPEKDIV